MFNSMRRSSCSRVLRYPIRRLQMHGHWDRVKRHEILKIIITRDAGRWAVCRQSLSMAVNKKMSRRQVFSWILMYDLNLGLRPVILVYDTPTLRGSQPPKRAEKVFTSNDRVRSGSREVATPEIIVF